MVVVNQNATLDLPGDKVYNKLNDKFDASEIITILVLSILLFVGTVGNSLVLFALGWRKRRSRTRFECLLTVLACVDLLASMVVPGLFIYGTSTRYRRWDFGYVGCKLISSLFPASVSISQSVLILISYERYKRISDPLRRNLKNSFIVLWMVITILVTGVLVSPYIYTLEIVSDKMYKIDTCMPSSNNINVLLIYAIGNLVRDLTATSIMICFSKLSSTMLKKGRWSFKNMPSKLRNLREKNSYKAKKMLVVVVFVFTICILPLDVYQVVIYTLYLSQYPLSKPAYKTLLRFNTFFTILQIANSSTNILIYSRMHEGFSQQLYLHGRRTIRSVTTIVSRLKSIKGDYSSESTILFPNELREMKIISVT